MPAYRWARLHSKSLRFFPPPTKLELLKSVSLNSLCSMILCQSPDKLHTRWKVKGQYGSSRHGHGKEATALEPLRLWTSSISELFFIEQRLSAAKVWQVGQSWAETTVLYKFTRGKMDLQHRLSFTVVSSREHLEIYKDKLIDARGLSHHRDKLQSWTHWDDWVNGMMDGRTDGQIAFHLYIEEDMITVTCSVAIAIT